MLDMSGKARSRAVRLTNMARIRVHILHHSHAVVHKCVCAHPAARSGVNEHARRSAVVRPERQYWTTRRGWWLSSGLGGRADGWKVEVEADPVDERHRGVVWQGAEEGGREEGVIQQGRSLGEVCHLVHTVN